ncbi:MAG: HlyD family secretion protein [Candidatus Pacebacteria bacterium]|nr:HlyD family secretion protein [Candidatus Paceibacterota bacterium]MDR3583111.1 HlyD family secretion protein [Candidatus Paceibacterota bacterium]
MENNNGMKNNISEKNGNGEKTFGRKRIMLLLLVLFLVAGAVISVYLYQATKWIYTDTAQIEAPPIDLSSASGGVLEKMFVSSGDQVSQNEVVAQVGNDMVQARDAGLVIATQNEIGKYFSPGTAVVTMVRPADLRLDAQVEEDKGLGSVKVGQTVSFTIDAFGSQKFSGVVDEVSSTAAATDVVFNISNARQEQNFDIKIRYDVAQYPELKNGMSARVWIYKN